jgi:hypothetical protein
MAVMEENIVEHSMILEIFGMIYISRKIVVTGDSAAAHRRRCVVGYVS